MEPWMWAVISMPIFLLLFGLVAAIAVWAIRNYAPSWMQPLALRIKRYPKVWGYILVFGALAVFMVVGSALGL